jgi:shikimate kinase
MTVPESRPVLVLIGAPGAGKTRLGKRVAKLLGAPFVDTDKMIVAEHGAIAEIFAEHGEPHFRELERAAVAEALTGDAVVSLGGGAVMHPETRANLAGHRIVLLTVTPEAVEARIASGKRPLVSGIDSWIALTEARRPVYESLATKTFDTSARPLDAIAAEVVLWIRESAAGASAPPEAQTGE